MKKYRYIIAFAAVLMVFVAGAAAQDSVRLEKLEPPTGCAYGCGEPPIRIEFIHAWGCRFYHTEPDVHYVYIYRHVQSLPKPGRSVLEEYTRNKAREDRRALPPAVSIEEVDSQMIIASQQHEDPQEFVPLQPTK